MKDDNVRTPRKNPYTSTQITLTHVMQSVSQKEKILDHFFHSVQNPFHEQIYHNLTLNLQNYEVYIFSYLKKLSKIQPWAEPILNQKLISDKPLGKPWQTLTYLTTIY